MSEKKSNKARHWSWLIALLVVVLVATPWVLANTTLRDRVINAIVNSDNIVVASRGASLGYFEPVSLSGLQVWDRHEAMQLEVAKIQADHSWLGLLLARPNLGTFRFDQPRIDVTLDPQALMENADSLDKADDTREATSADVELPNFAAQIVDGSLTVRTKKTTEAPIDLQHIQLMLRLEKRQDGSALRIDPTTVFDHQAITPELCGEGLQLIAPLLADEVDAKGEFSLRLARFEIPIGASPDDRKSRIDVAGELQLHEASVGLRNTIAKGISDLVFELLGLGIPGRLTVAKDLIVRFEVVDGRIRHEGLALLLPHRDSSIEFVSSGSVGLDETLDLRVTVKLPDTITGGNALVQRFTKEPIELAITGSFDKPKISLANQDGLIKSIRDLVDPESPGQDKQQAVGEVVSGAVDIVGGVLEGIRRRSEQRSQEPSNPQTNEQPNSENRPLFPNLGNRFRDRSRLRDRRTPSSDQPPADSSRTPPNPPTPNPPTPNPPTPGASKPPQPIDL